MSSFLRLGQQITPIISIGSRLLLSSAIFFVVANRLGVEAYGIFVVQVTYALLIGQISDFGLQTKTIRDIASERKTWEQAVVDALTVKLITTPIGIITAYLFIYLIRVQVETNIIINLSIFYITNGILEIYFCVLRARHRVRTEASAIFLANTLTSLISVYFLYTDGAAKFAESLAISRITILIVAAAYTVNSLLPYIRDISKASILREFKRSAGFGVDSLTTNLGPTLQGVAIASLAPAMVTGQYQLFQRLIQGFNTLFMVSLQRHLPLMSSARSQTQKHQAYSQYFLANMVMLTAAVATIFIIYLGGFGITLGLHGNSIALLPYLSALIAARYFAATQGTFLVVDGKQRQKATIASLSATIAVLSTWIASHYHPSLALFILIDTFVAIASFSAYKIARSHANTI